MAIIILIYKYNGSVKGENLVYLYGLVMVLFMMNNWKSLSETMVGKDGSLYWSWNHWEYSGYFYIFFLGMLLYLSYYNLSAPYNKVLPFIILSLFIVSYFKYGVEVYGRFWCFFAPFIPLVFFFVRETQVLS